MTSRRDTLYMVQSRRAYTSVHTISTRYHVMNDYDASYVWDYEMSCHDLDETYRYDIQNTYDLDEDYARDSCDYTQLAYTYFA